MIENKYIKLRDEMFLFRHLKLKDMDEHYFTLLRQLSIVEHKTISEENNKEFFKRLNEDHVIVVIEHNKKIVGSGTIIIEHKLIRGYGKVGHIEDIVIDKDFRNYGLGKYLVCMLKDYSLTNKCYKCILNCSKQLKDFYEKCDFKKQGLEMAKYFD